MKVQPLGNNHREMWEGRRAGLLESRNAPSGHGLLEPRGGLHDSATIDCLGGSPARRCLTGVSARFSRRIRVAAPCLERALAHVTPRQRRHLPRQTPAARFPGERVLHNIGIDHLRDVYTEVLQPSKMPLTCAFPDHGRSGPGGASNQPGSRHQIGPKVVAESCQDLGCF